MAYKGKPERSRALWRSKTDVSDDVFDFLYQDYLRQEEKLREIDTPQMMDMASAFLMNSENSWYLDTQRNAFKTMKKLSKGFPVGAEQLAVLFVNDDFIGSDIRDVLLNPKMVPGSYPDRIVHSSYIFMRGLCSGLEIEAIQNNEGIEQFVSDALDLTEEQWNPISLKHNTALRVLIDAQQMSRNMEKTSDVLKQEKLLNLASIADAFSSRGEAIFKDVYSRVEAAINSTELSAEVQHSILDTGLG